MVSRATTAELIRVIANPKFRLSAPDREDILAAYLPWCEVVRVAKSLETPEIRDPFDKKFVELENDNSFEIMTPAEFRKSVDR